MAEGVGFEPTMPFGMPVFKTGAINRSTTPPMVFEPDNGNYSTKSCKRAVWQVQSLKNRTAALLKLRLAIAIHHQVGTVAQLRCP